MGGEKIILELKNMSEIICLPLWSQVDVTLTWMPMSLHPMNELGTPIVPDVVSSWCYGNSCSVAGAVSVASLGILCGEHGTKMATGRAGTISFNVWTKHQMCTK